MSFCLNTLPPPLPPFANQDALWGRSTSWHACLSLGSVRINWWWALNFIPLYSSLLFFVIPLCYKGFWLLCFQRTVGRPHHRDCFAPKSPKFKSVPSQENFHRKSHKKTSFAHHFQFMCVLFPVTVQLLQYNYQKLTYNCICARIRKRIRQQISVGRWRWTVGSVQFQPNTTQHRHIFLPV